jgi:hypothetical protein
VRAADDNPPAVDDGKARAAGTARRASDVLKRTDVAPASWETASAMPESHPATSSDNAPCVACGSPMGHRLDLFVSEAWENYFRCWDCGHIWTTPTDGEQGESQDVTERRADARGERGGQA